MCLSVDSKIGDFAVKAPSLVLTMPVAVLC